MSKIILTLLILGVYILINLSAIYYVTSYGHMVSLFKKSKHYQALEKYQTKWNVPIWVGEFIWETQSPRNPLMIPAFLWTRFTKFRYLADNSMAKIVDNESWGWSYWEYEKTAFEDDNLNQIFSKYLKSNWRPGDTTPKLVVKGKEIQTEDGSTVILKGPNLPLKNLAYYSNLEADEETFQKLDEMGANVVRIIINLDATMPQEGDWSQKSLDTLKNALDLAEKHHIYVVLNIHKYHFLGFPKWYIQRYKDGFNGNYNKFSQMWLNRQPPFEDSWDFFVEGWKKIIEVSKGRNIVAGYDLLNEPGRGYKLYEYLSEKIEPFDPGKIHFAETMHLFNDMTGEEKPKISNLVLSPHLYDIWRRNVFIILFITSTLLFPVVFFLILLARLFLSKRR